MRSGHISSAPLDGTAGAGSALSARTADGTAAHRGVSAPPQGENSEGELHGPASDLGLEPAAQRVDGRAFDGQ